MAKKTIFTTEEIYKAIERLPYFTIDDLAVFGKDKHYFKTLIFRWKKRGLIISLKKGFYVSQVFLESIKFSGKLDVYIEFLGNNLYEPSYLSLEYVLAKYTLLTEAVRSITLVSTNKTKTFTNELAVFNYYHLKKELFSGFAIKEKGGFLVAEASLAKALFDFLYFRKNFLFSRQSVKALRLNLENLKKGDWRELKRYISLEGSKRMGRIFGFLSNL